MVAAGDLIGASPLLSSLFHDEPTIESLSKMGLAITSVGNHEFDEGWQELRRMQDGGCHPVDGCKGPKPFEGAKFEYLAASTFLDSGQTLFPPYTVRTFDGVKVGFIGLTLEGTPDVITPAARAGITFRDEAETVNALVPKLKAEGVEAIVVLLHEGGFTNATLDDCHGLTGTITEIVPKFDKAVDVVVTGHTNGIYICTLDGRLVTSAGAYGTRVTDISLLIDRKTGDVIGKSARDIVIRRGRLCRRSRPGRAHRRLQEAGRAADDPAGGDHHCRDHPQERCKRRKRARRHHRRLHARSRAQAPPARSTSPS